MSKLRYQLSSFYRVSEISTTNYYTCGNQRNNSRSSATSNALCRDVSLYRTHSYSNAKGTSQKPLPLLIAAPASSAVSRGAAARTVFLPRVLAFIRAEMPRFLRARGAVALFRRTASGMGLASATSNICSAREGCERTSWEARHVRDREIGLPFSLRAMVARSAWKWPCCGSSVVDAVEI